MPKLLLQNLKGGEEQEYNLDQPTIVFGRTNTCDIELDQKSVSRRHAEIIREGQNYFLFDLKSGNGTFLNNKKIRPQEKNLLRSGDLIRIEDFEIRFSMEEEASEEAFEENTDTDILEIKLIKKMMKALDKDDVPSLEILSGSAQGKRVMIPEEVEQITLGRDEKSDFCISDHVLSRFHAKLERKWGGVVITDLNSKNGTFVNREPVNEKLLHDGDRVILGTIKCLYRNPKEISLQMAHQELMRKKKEAALQEAELLAQKKLEEEKRAQELAAEEQARKDEEARALEESIRQAEEEEARARAEAERLAEEEAARKIAEESEAKAEVEASPEAEKSKFSKMELAFIGVGVLVGLLAVGGIVWVLL